jgi:hypothetical protein
MGVATIRDAISSKALEIKRALGSLGNRLSLGDESELVVWVIPGALACAHRPLRYHPKFGGSRRDLPAEATDAVVNWVDQISGAGFRSIICLMHPKEVGHYAALRLGATDLITYYGLRGFRVCHKPWDDPAHRPPGEHASFKEELGRIQVESLECFDRLPKPVLLHCSAGIDRSSPVAAFIWSHRSHGTTTITT